MGEQLHRIRTAFFKRLLSSAASLNCALRFGRIGRTAGIFLLFLFSFSNAAAQTYLMGNSQVSTCSGRFFDSGDSTGQYANRENFIMRFCSNQPNKCIQFTFTFFTIESGNDTLYVHNGPDTSAALLGKFTGSTIPTVLVGTAGCITFRFKSNNTNTRAGWAASISCVDCMPGACIVECSGIIPTNDACGGAQNLDTLPRPAPCVSGNGGVAAWRTLATSNLCSSAEFPYSSMQGCFPSGKDSMSDPASDVWYRFVITAPVLNVRVTGLQVPTVGLYRGTACNNLVPLGCAVGSNGYLNTSFTGLPIGVYYLQVSGGSMVDRCLFSLELQNNFDCQGCVIQANLTANPPPVDGTYLAGQRVNFCYTITDYEQYFSNWLHGVVPSFGPGWDMTTLTTSPAIDCPVAPANGTWSWYNTPITSSYTGNTAGPGFFFETASGGPGLDSDPGNNYGDYNPGNMCDWTFC